MRTAKELSSRSRQRQPGGPVTGAADRSGQFAQGQRIAPCEVEHGRPARRVEVTRSGVEDVLGGLLVERLQVERRQHGVEQRPAFARPMRHQRDDAVGRDPPRDEREHQLACVVHPLGVVDQQQQWSVAAASASRSRTATATWNRSGGSSAGAPKAISRAARRCPADPGRDAEQRPHQLVHRGVGQAELGRAADRAHDPQAVTGGGLGPLEQR